jgi:prepilin-type N-terminal cleavage/methylation domain-containing protein
MRSILPNNKLLNSESGFTLLEVLISIIVLSFISLGIYQATSETYKLREELLNESDFYSTIRLTMGVMQRDVTLMYSPIVLLPQASPSPALAGGFQSVPNPGARPSPSFLQTDPDLAQESDFWGPALDKTGIRPSRFVGTEKKISFISSSHIRLYKDTQESTFAKVTYELVTDEFDPSSQMLVKTESFDAFQMEERKDTSKRIYPLMHGIKTLKFRFYNKNKDNGTWEPSWDSVDSDEDRNIYPDVIEVNFEVYGLSKMYFNGVYDFKPELPFNGIDPSS